MCELAINIVATILGGLILTFLLFVLNEFVFKKVNLSGNWTTTIEIVDTTFNPYQNLQIEYKIHLLQKGYEISGSGEKIKDINQDGSETVFEREKRVVVTVDGYFERRYLAMSSLYLNITEGGTKRESRASYILKIKANNKIQGTFSSTAADSSGKVTMLKL